MGQKARGLSRGMNGPLAVPFCRQWARRELQRATMKSRVQVRLYPTPEQAVILRAHGQESISTINVWVAALESDVVPDGGKGTSTKDCSAVLPSAVKDQARRDARAIWNRSFGLGVLPVLRTPNCQWTGQNWRMEGATLGVPGSQGGKVQQISRRCARLSQAGTPGLLRITRKRAGQVAGRECVHAA